MDEITVALFLLLLVALLAQFVAQIYQMRQERRRLQERLGTLAHDLFDLRRRNQWLERRLFDLVDATELALDGAKGGRSNLQRVVRELREESSRNGYVGYYSD